MKILTLAAMDCEVRSIREAGLECVQTGIGKVNAALTATQAILELRPDAIVSTGCAGALAGDLHRFDVVIGRECAWHDVWCGEGIPVGTVQGEPRRFLSEERLLETARKAIPQAHEGLIVSGDQFFISPEEDRRILSIYPDALASDMESTAIAQVCHHFGIPFLPVRIISDVHTSKEEQRSGYGSFKETVCSRDLQFLTKLISMISYQL